MKQKTVIQMIYEIFKIEFVNHCGLPFEFHINLDSNICLTFANSRRNFLNHQFYQYDIFETLKNNNYDNFVVARVGGKTDILIYNSNDALTYFIELNESNINNATRELVEYEKNFRTPNFDNWIEALSKQIIYKI